jgi:GNAT superfamily N-acetyltransferase
MPTVRPAGPADREFIAATYASIGFEQTRDDDVLVVEHDGSRVGLGRLIPVADDIVELGGIWTDERHRRLGIAATIVRALLERAAGRRVYCIPFRPLADYYKRFGFVEARVAETVPRVVAEKVAVSERKFSQGVTLLRMP